MKLTILGNNSAIPIKNRFPTAQILEIGNELMLIDCGEGTQMRMTDAKIKRGRIKKIFISHLHGDHYFGLIGLLTSMSLGNRNEAIELFAPTELEQIIKLQLAVAKSELSFPLLFRRLNFENPEVLIDNRYYTISSFPTDHRIHCCGFRFDEKDPKRHLNINVAEQYEIPKEFYQHLAEGEDYISPEGNTIKNEWVTFPQKQTKSYAYCADTLFTTAFLPSIMNCDLIYHETTYLKDQEDLAKMRFHSTTIQAGKIAELSKAKKLSIGHFSSKYRSLDDFLTETKEVFPNTEIAAQYKVFEI